VKVQVAITNQVSYLTRDCVHNYYHVQIVFSRRLRMNDFIILVATQGVLASSWLRLI